MTQPNSNRSRYRLLKLISRQPIQLGRFFARLVAVLLPHFSFPNFQNHSTQHPDCVSLTWLNQRTTDKTGN